MTGTFLKTDRVRTTGPGFFRMSADFSNITILGGGLLGGSLAMALDRLGTAAAVRLWARRPETVAAARARGIAGPPRDLAEAVAGAELLVLAVPVGAMAPLVAQALDAGLPAGCLVTDVGSVKRVPHQSIPPVLAGRGIDFIGSHPMAGSERNGLAAAAADLFQTPPACSPMTNSAPPARAAALERFWQSVGCRTTWLSAADHDALVARISHLPHILAASAARVCLKTRPMAASAAADCATPPASPPATRRCGRKSSSKTARRC